MSKRNQNETSDSWKANLTLGVAIMAVLLGIGGCTYLERKGQALVDKARVTTEEQNTK